jgi:hypothetical protein
MALIRHCIGGGFLVATDGWLPTAAFDRHWAALAPQIGCNHLHCSSCDCDVRQASGFAGDGGLSPQSVYDFLGGVTPADGKTPPRHPEGRGRLYACRCHVAHVYSTHAVTEPFDPMSGDTAPWSCAGHPPLELPATVEGVALDDASNWAAFARGVFSGAQAPVVDPAVRYVEGFFVQRIYNALIGAPAGALARAVANLLTDGEPLVRLAAIRFFQLNPEAAGGERLVAAIRDHAALFVGVRDPNATTATLWDSLVEALDWRMRNDPEALEQVKARALVAPGIGRVLYSLAWQHPDWVIAHASDILAAAPSEWGTLLNALSQQPAARLAALAIVAAKYASATDILAFSSQHLPPDAQAAIAKDLSEHQSRN